MERPGNKLTEMNGTQFPFQNSFISVKFLLSQTHNFAMDVLILLAYERKKNNNKNNHMMYKYFILI